MVDVVYRNKIVNVTTSELQENVDLVIKIDELIKIELEYV